MGKRGRKRRRAFAASRHPGTVFIHDGRHDDELGRHVRLSDDKSTWSMDDWRGVHQQMAEHVGAWEGIPIDLEDLTLTLAPGHPLADIYRPPARDVRVVVGGPPSSDGGPVVLHECSTDDTEGGERIVNEWYDASHNRDVLIVQRANGRAFAVTVPRPPDGAMDRLTFAVSTIGASDAWSLDAEAKAMEKLQSHVNEQQLRHYLLTGSFLETSTRSDLTYVFRRLRPTVVLTPRWPYWNAHKHDTMRVLAVLCMHPLGYYQNTWAGAMVPTDDVLAHLLYMRGDEAGFWRQATQHDPATPNAGL